MTVRLHESWAATLRELPETGMGYQVLELKSPGFRPEHVIVANGQLTVDPARGRLVVREGIDRGTEERVEKALSGPVRDASFSVLSRKQAVAVKAISSVAPSAGRPASEAPVEQSGSEERFLRFSAFPNDIRILADGSVTAGTYVTTYADGITVPTGTGAVQRYALPNPAPAVHRYYLQPPKPISIQRGTVQPAYGQPGGGAEVIFVNGAPAKTKYKQDQIPAV
jgi:hypothetical protein